MAPNGKADRKVDAASKPPPPEVVRCSYVVPNKGRRCRFPVLPGTSFCGAHREDESVERVPCPLDPNHTVFKNRLQQHLKICTKARDQSVVQRQPFYRRGVNGAGDSVPSALADAVAVSAAGEEVVRDWMRRISEAWPKAVKQVLGEATCPEGLLEKSVVLEGGQLAHAEKHDVQNQALADLILQDLRLKSKIPGVVLVEYGSGKGGLANAVLRQCPGLRCVLVEREPRRHKFENKQDNKEEQVLRLRLDIVDFDLQQFLSPALDPQSLPSAADLSGGALKTSTSSTKAEGFGPAERLEELWRAAASFQAAGEWPPSSLLACAKHLCGGATDIALRSLKAASKSNVEGSNGHMVCVATCCHHRCDIHSYVNRPFLEGLGLCDSAQDFAQFVSTAGWAVGGFNRSDSTLARRVHDLEKRKVGMMAKRILDLGRVAWLRQELQLPDATLMDYISKAVTPENMVIVAPVRSGVSRSWKCLAWCCG